MEGARLGVLTFFWDWVLSGKFRCKYLNPQLKWTKSAVNLIWTRGWGEIWPQFFSFFPQLQDGVTFSKNGLTKFSEKSLISHPLLVSRSLGLDWMGFTIWYWWDIAVWKKRTNCFWKVHEIESGSWQRWLGWRALFLKSDYRSYRGRSTKDIWEDQKAGGPKNLLRGQNKCQKICSQLYLLNKTQ